MFERYTEKVRRTIFFARYEASMRGAQFIGTPHLLLGLLRENKSLFTDLFGDVRRLPELISAMDEQWPEGKDKLPTSADMALEHPAKRVLAYAAEESQRMNAAHIDPAHLLLGLIRENGPEVALLTGFEITLEKVRSVCTAKPALEKSRRLLHELLAAIPESRLAAAEAVLTALSTEGSACAVRGFGPDGKFSFSYPGKGSASAAK